MNNKIFKKIIFVLITILSLNSAYSITAEFINSNPSPVLAGEYADITIRFLEKSETEHIDVEIIPQETNFILLAESESIYLSELTDDNSVTRTFKIFVKENTPEGKIEFPIKIKTSKITTESNIEFFVQNSIDTPDVRLIDGETIPKELVINTKDNKALIQIQNLGEKEAKLIRAELEFDENSLVTSSYPGSLDDTISILRANEQGEFEFQFDIDENAIDNSDYKLKVTYLVENALGNKLEEKEFLYEGKFEFSKAPRIEILNIEYLDSFEIDSKGNRIKLTLKNTGSADAENVKMRLAPDVSYPLEFDKLSKFVGYSIPMGETATILYKVDILKDAQAREYSNKLIIDSLIGDARFPQDYNLKIPVNENTKILTPLVIALLVIGLVLIVAVTIGLGKRKHK